MLEKKTAAQAFVGSIVTIVLGILTVYDPGIFARWPSWLTALIVTTFGTYAGYRAPHTPRTPYGAAGPQGQPPQPPSWSPGPTR